VGSFLWSRWTLTQKFCFLLYAVAAANFRAMMVAERKLTGANGARSSHEKNVGEKKGGEKSVSFAVARWGRVEKFNFF